MDVEMKVTGLKHDNPDRLMKDTFQPIAGVNQIAVYEKGGIVKITYEQEVISLDHICNIIEDLGIKVDR